MERHRRPCGWRAAFMMYGVRNFEPIGPVHHPVGPVKPCVMCKQESRHRYWHVPQRILRYIRIYLGPAQIVPAPCGYARRDSIDGRAGKAPTNFSPNLRRQARIKRRKFTLCQQSKTAAGYQITDTDNDRHSGSGEKNREVHLTVTIGRCAQFASAKANRCYILRSVPRFLSMPRHSAANAPAATDLGASIQTGMRRSAICSTALAIGILGHIGSAARLA